MTDDKARRRWITLGELIAFAALVVSALGVWIAWKNSKEEKPTRIVQQRSSVPLALRASRDSDGRTLLIMPADPSHALEGLTIRMRGASPIDVGSDGRLAASDIEAALKDREKESKDLTLRVPVRIDARYVEAGNDRKASGSYQLSYKWEGGGLFGGRSLHFVGLSRA